MVNKLLMSFRFSLLQGQHDYEPTPRSPAVPCSHGQPTRSHSATMLPSANHECEGITIGMSGAVPRSRGAAGRTMSPLIDALPD